MDSDQAEERLLASRAQGQARQDVMSDLDRVTTPAVVKGVMGKCKAVLSLHERRDAVDFTDASGTARSPWRWSPPGPLRSRPYAARWSFGRTGGTSSMTPRTCSSFIAITSASSRSGYTRARPTLRIGGKWP